MSELVLAIHRHQISSKDTGVIPFDLSSIDPKAYALLPRHIVDHKKELSASADRIGIELPQILGYFQLVLNGKYLAYQRKGKEKGLFGQWSIGIGGHVSQEDLEELICQTGESYPDLVEFIYAGALRELEEEVGVDPRWFEQLGSVDDFGEAATSIIQSFANSTSSRHVGIPMTLSLNEASFDESNLRLDPAEFCNIKWLTEEELKDSVDVFEDWSQILINNM